jgi:hypothetical protein
MGINQRLSFRMRLDYSVVFFTLLMYLYTIEEFFFTGLGCCSATVVTDSHCLFYVYVDTVSPVGEQFFRLALTLITLK